jgi:uncharacterized protein (TIGR02246 family)
MPDTLVAPRRQVLLGAALSGIAVAAPAFGQATPANAASVEALKAMLDAYTKAFSAHDMAGVLKLFSPDAVVLGTGPGEIWGGSDEIAIAHKNFFSLFDPGKHTQEVQFRDGHVLGDMAWLASMSSVSFTKGANTIQFGLNLSAVFEKTGGTWQIRVLHMSNAATTPAASK